MEAPIAIDADTIRVGLMQLLVVFTPATSWLQPPVKMSFGISRWRRSEIKET
jgi:hypothetical protein